MIPDIIRFFNGGEIPIFQNSGVIPEIEPSVVTAPSAETKTFFDDYADRYEKYHNKNIEDVIKKRIHNDSPITNVDEWQHAAAYYKPTSDRVNMFTDKVLNDDDFSATYTHELVHKLNDRLIKPLKRTKSERKLLKEGYGKANLEQLPFLKRMIYRPQAIKENFTTNTELRRRISLKNGNLTGKALDDYIMSMSDEELGNMFEIQGYFPRSNYNKAFEGNTGEELFYNVHKVDPENIPQELHWDTLSRKDKRYYNRLARRGNDVFKDYSLWDSDRLAKVRNALITIA